MAKNIPVTSTMALKVTRTTGIQSIMLFVSKAWATQSVADERGSERAGTASILLTSAETAMRHNVPVENYTRGLPKRRGCRCVVWRREKTSNELGWRRLP